VTPDDGAQSAAHGWGSLLQAVRAGWLYAVITLELVVIVSLLGWIAAGLVLPEPGAAETVNAGGEALQ
jgi:hypothetical protein